MASLRPWPAVAASCALLACGCKGITPSKGHGVPDAAMAGSPDPTAAASASTKAQGDLDALIQRLTELEDNEPAKSHSELRKRVIDLERSMVTLSLGAQQLHPQSVYYCQETEGVQQLCQGPQADDTPFCEPDCHSPFHGPLPAAASLTLAPGYGAQIERAFVLSRGHGKPDAAPIRVPVVDERIDLGAVRGMESPTVFVILRRRDQLRTRKMVWRLWGI